MSSGSAEQPDPIEWYDANAAAVAERHESVSAALVNAWLEPFLPSAGALVADIGAGGGGTALWLANRGLEVVAAEPSHGMREAARKLGRMADARIRWVSVGLPGLETLHRQGLTFDFILVSAVWQHVAPGQRARAFRKLVTLLKSGGALAITLRHGLPMPGGVSFEVSAEELERLARDHGTYVAHRSRAEDELNRDGIWWERMIIRLPDDGTGALPLLRHVILTDNKSSTYKLALLRVLTRIANDALGCVTADDDDGFVKVPLGLVGLYWLRQFKPVLAAGLPQMPGQRGLEKLGFVRAAFRRILDDSDLDLQVGRQFGGQQGRDISEAIADAVRNLVTMPIRRTAFPDKSRVFGTTGLKTGRTRLVTGLEVNAAYLESFGHLRVPAHVWHALTRFSVWIEPALIAEWTRLMQEYAAGQQLPFSEGAVTQALRWADPERDTAFARQIALGLLANGGLHCVWSGRTLEPGTLDVDHCFPWATWPCGDLWNLLPAHRQVNQRQKKEKIPTAHTLFSARARILGWWQAGYTESGNEGTKRRFELEAASSLPGIPARPGLDEVHEGMLVQRTRLVHDQQAPEWDGTRQGYG